MNNVADKILSRMRRKANAPKKDNGGGDKRELTFGRAMRYAFLPDLGSRIRDIGKRLGGFAYFLAQIFYSCRLIPAGHPTLQPANIGYFGFADVISTAAANLQLRKENTDQIVLFSAVILSMVLLVANGLAIAAYAVLDVNTAFAQTAPTGAAGASGSMFASPNPESDLGLKFLDLVFGTTSVGMFGTDGVTSRVGADPIKDALYHMLGLYSTAMMVVAVVIILYYAFVVVGESAMTGQPFGKRFNSFWAPIRLVVGLGLLVPIAGGLNAAQYMTLFVAKMGSGFASYAWSGFVEKLAQSDLVSDTTPYPSVTDLVTSIVRFETCKAVVNQENFFSEVSMQKEDVTAERGRQSGTVFRWNSGSSTGGMIVSAVSPVGALASTLSTNYVPAACGEIFIPKQPQAVGDNDTSIMGDPEVQQAWAAMHEQYVGMVETISRQVGAIVVPVVAMGSLVDKSPQEAAQEPAFQSIMALSGTVISTAQSTTRAAVDGFKTAYENKFREKIANRISAFDDKGWLGAGMFYLQIADLNGGLVNATRTAFPHVTGDIVGLPSDKEMEDEENTWGGWAASWFGNAQVDGAAFNNETVRAMRKTLGNITAAFNQGENPEIADARSYRQNFFTMMLIDLFGGEYIRNFREIGGANPIADFVALGHGMMTKGLDYITFVIMALALGPLGTIVGFIATLLIPFSAGASTVLAFAGWGLSIASAILAPIAGFVISACFIGFALGSFLYYVIPLLPLIYFFFAILEWVLGVLEAMVGLPLWALAHIRIDGDGLSGQGAQTGYLIIFGILVRPFVILFSLIISIIFFTACMTIFKEMFSVYVGAIGTGESGGDYSAIDYMFFSIIYAVIGYIAATLSFKQVDQMPKQIMRWFGGSDPRYDDGQADPVGTLDRAMFAVGAVSVNQGQAALKTANDAMSGVSKVGGPPIGGARGGRGGGGGGGGGAGGGGGGP